MKLNRSVWGVGNTRDLGKAVKLVLSDEPGAEAELKRLTTDPAEKLIKELINAWVAGRKQQAEAAGLRTVGCTTPGCLARDFWLNGEAREERRARNYMGNHKKHSRA